jgi:hypothetical protein
MYGNTPSAHAFILEGQIRLADRMAAELPGKRVLVVEDA